MVRLRLSVRAFSALLIGHVYHPAYPLPVLVGQALWEVEAVAGRAACILFAHGGAPQGICINLPHRRREIPIMASQRRTFRYVAVPAVPGACRWQTGRRCYQRPECAPAKLWTISAAAAACRRRHAARYGICVKKCS